MRLPSVAVSDALGITVRVPEPVATRSDPFEAVVVPTCKLPVVVVRLYDVPADPVAVPVICP